MKRLRAVTVAGSEYSAGSVLDHVEAYGGHVTRHNISHVLAASQTLLNGVTGGRVLHPTELDSQTEAEIVNAGKAQAGDGLSRLSRTDSTGSSASAFAVASAVHVIIGPGPGRPAIVTGAA